MSCLALRLAELSLRIPFSSGLPCNLFTWTSALGVLIGVVLAA